MKVGEVEVFMYEDVLFIDVGTAVMHHPSTRHTNMMSGGVSFGLCAEEEREVMELLPEMETRKR